MNRQPSKQNPNYFPLRCTKTSGLSLFKHFNNKRERKKKKKGLKINIAIELFGFLILARR